MPYLFGRKCKAGWGYNVKNNYFIQNVKIDDLETESNHSLVGNTTISGSDTENDFCQKFSCIQNSPVYGFCESVINKNLNAYKLMDFLIENHEIDGFISNLQQHSNWKKAKKSNNYLPETTHFVEEVQYGLDMFIFFDGNNKHLFHNHDNGQFLSNIWIAARKLTEEQKKLFVLF